MVDVFKNGWKDKIYLKNEGGTLRKMTEFEMRKQNQCHLLGCINKILLSYNTEIEPIKKKL